jgi:hypothetical protein
MLTADRASIVLAAHIIPAAAGMLANKSKTQARIETADRRFERSGSWRAIRHALTAQPMPRTKAPRPA